MLKAHLAVGSSPRAWGGLPTPGRAFGQASKLKASIFKTSNFKDEQMSRISDKQTVATRKYVPNEQKGDTEYRYSRLIFLIKDNF